MPKKREKIEEKHEKNAIFRHYIKNRYVVPKNTVDFRHRAYIFLHRPKIKVTLMSCAKSVTYVREY